MENCDGALFRVFIAIASRGSGSIVTVVWFFWGDGDGVQRDLLMGGNLSHGCYDVNLGMGKLVEVVFPRRQGDRETKGVLENESPAIVEGE